MKKILCFMILSIVALNVVAQPAEYVMLAFDKDGAPVNVLMTKDVKGLVNIADREYTPYNFYISDYYKFWSAPGPGQNGYTFEFVGTILLCQENGIVYCYDSDTNSESELLNYNLKIGDEFTRPDGQNLIVEDKKTDDTVTLWLRDTATGEQDIWCSNYGSLTTGYLLKNSVPDLEITQLLKSGMYDYLSWDNDNVVQFTFHPRQLTSEESHMNFITYTFEDDTLCIKGRYSIYGVKSLNDHIVRVVKDGFHVFVEFYEGQHNTSPNFNDASHYEYDIKIGGFASGTYCINGYNAENLSLECKGLNNDATGISSIGDVQAKEASEIYDLTGRRLDHEPAQGLYIKDGRKVLKR